MSNKILHQRRDSLPTLRRGGLPEMCWEGISSLMDYFIRHCLTVKMEPRPAATELSLHPIFKEIIPEIVSCPSSFEIPYTEPSSPLVLVRQLPGDVQKASRRWDNF